MRGKIIGAAIVLAGSVALAGPAHAATCPTGNTCGVGGYNGNGDAMNDWNATSGKVYAYASGKTNENFGTETMARCSGSDTVTSTCPFTDHSMDAALLGKPITQTVYIVGNSVTCVGTDNTTDTDAILVGCNNPNTGTGGGLWSAFVVAGNDSLVSVGCTNLNDSWCQLDQSTPSAWDFFALSSNVEDTYWTPVP